MVDGARKNCDECRAKGADYHQQKYDEAVERGACARCWDDPRTVGLLCFPCWLKSTSSNNTGTVKNWAALLDLWKKQDGRCAYTGEALRPGDNASLDHIVPLARGGGNGVDNLQWVTKQINFMKRDMTHEEFVGMCCFVAARWKV